MIYLIDLDGVIVDLDSAVYKYYGITPKIGEWSENVGKSDDLILKDIDNFLFWQTLPKYPWSDQLIELISSTTDKWAFCSTPTNNPECWSGKAAWIKFHYPKYLSRLVLTRDKFRLASHQHCLIDDRKQNLVKFENAGGKTIPFPSLNGHFTWTENQLKDPVEYVRRNLSKIETQRITKI